MRRLKQSNKQFKQTKIMSNIIDFKKIDKDINGNSRVVCHFLNFVTDKDAQENKSMMINATNTLYEVALKKAKKIGGKKYHNKKYGGGIVFQCTNITELQNLINSIL